MSNHTKSNRSATLKTPILITLLIILFVGAWLRLHQLNSLPPGLFMDEAVNGIDAQGIWRNGRFSIFFPANNGREPIYIYMQALMMRLIGEHAFGIRIVSAYSGILTIPLAYVLAKTLFRKNKTHATYIGLVAAAVLATSFWHVSLSRLGFRTILLPFFCHVSHILVLAGMAKETNTLVCHSRNCHRPDAIYIPGRTCHARYLHYFCQRYVPLESVTF